MIYSSTECLYGHTDLEFLRVLCKPCLYKLILRHRLLLLPDVMAGHVASRDIRAFFFIIIFYFYYYLSEGSLQF